MAKKGVTYMKIMYFALRVYSLGPVPAFLDIYIYIHVCVLNVCFMCLEGVNSKPQKSALGPGSICSSSSCSKRGCPQNWKILLMVKVKWKTMGLGKHMETLETMLSLIHITLN